MNDRWDGFVIVCDDSVTDEAMQVAMEEWLDKHHPEYAWDVCAENRGMAEGTYGKNYGRLPQILGFSVGIPEDVEPMIQDAFNTAIDTANTPTNGEIMEAANERLLAHSKSICTPGCLGCMDEWQQGEEAWT